MGQISLHTDHRLDAEYTTKRGKVLDLPAAPVHQALHVIRQVVQGQSSEKCNVVVAAFGLVYSPEAHWTMRDKLFSSLYHGFEKPSLKAAWNAKQKRVNPMNPFDQADGKYFSVEKERRKAAQERAAAEGQGTFPSDRVWKYTILEAAFCSGARSTHGTPSDVVHGASSIKVIHKEDLGDEDAYKSLAEKFNAAGGRIGSSHNAMVDNHSEFHFAVWLHQNFVQSLGQLPAHLSVPSGSKIYAVTVDFVSTNEICSACARKLDGLLSPGYLESLSELYFNNGYATSTRKNTEGGMSGLRLVMRASASKRYAGAATPVVAGVAPIQVKECYFNGSVTIHETNVIPI